MSAKNKFQKNHPKFVAFLNRCFAGGLKEGTIFPILNKPMGVYGKQTKGDIIFKNGGM